MNAIQQLMVAIISVVLGATSTQVFNQLTVQETKILFWVSMLLLVSIFVWSATKASWKKNVRKRSSPPKKRKPKRSKRRAKPP
jgi:multisubunit Na+/H+ antiporter MnhE subunit